MAFPASHNGATYPDRRDAMREHADVVQENSLEISNFGPVDGSSNLLLLAMQEDMLKDSKRKCISLTQA